MFEIVNNFLIPGAYSREKGQFARKVSSHANLFRSKSFRLGLLVFDFHCCQSLQRNGWHLALCLLDFDLPYCLKLEPQIQLFGSRD